MRSGERILLAVLFVFCSIAAYTAGYVMLPKPPACDCIPQTSEPDLFATLNPDIKTIALEGGMNITMGREYPFGKNADCYWVLRINGVVQRIELCSTMGRSGIPDENITDLKADCYTQGHIDGRASILEEQSNSQFHSVLGVPEGFESHRTNEWREYADCIAYNKGCPKNATESQAAENMRKGGITTS